MKDQPWSMGRPAMADENTCHGRYVTRPWSVRRHAMVRERPTMVDGMTCHGRWRDLPWPVNDQPRLVERPAMAAEATYHGTWSHRPWPMGKSTMAGGLHDAGEGVIDHGRRRGRLRLPSDRSIPEQNVKDQRDVEFGEITLSVSGGGSRQCTVQWTLAEERA
jgi:hypothetical protein